MPGSSPVTTSCLDSDSHSKSLPTMLIRKISSHSQLETPHWLQRKLAATLCASIGLAIFYICPEAIGEEPAEVIFARKVLPLFKTRCLACHGEKPEKLKGEFDLRSRAGLLSGGESEKPAVVAGKPLESPLYLAVTREYEDDWKSMPPKKNDKLSDQEVKYIRDWITGGAPWPDEKRLAELLAQKDPWATEGRITVKTSGGLSSEWTNREYDPEGLWAYQPLKRPKVPKEGANPIDAFIDAPARRIEGGATGRSGNPHPARRLQPDRPAAEPEGGR